MTKEQMEMWKWGSGANMSELIMYEVCYRMKCTMIITSSLERRPRECMHM